MADRLRWFKLWTNILHDTHFFGLQLEDIARWAFLGALTAEQGDGGVLRVSTRQLAALLRCDESDVDDVTKRLPNLHVEEMKKCDGWKIVTFKKWHKYQVDDSSKRTQKYRQNVTVQEEKRREEKKKRGEKKKEPPLLPPQTAADFDRIWSAYPKKQKRAEALRAFCNAKPHNGDLSVWLTAIEWQRTQPDWLKERGRFVPLLSSWINGRRWEDEPPAIPSEAEQLILQEREDLSDRVQASLALMKGGRDA